MSQAARTHVALVTGGAVRLGAAISRALAADGYAVAVNYHRSEEEATTLVNEILDAGGRAAAFPADITAAGERDQLVEAVENRLGPIDLLVNNAAIFESRPFLEIDDDLWRRHLALNLEAPMYLSLRIGGRMRARGAGRIVNICGTVGIEPLGEYTAYCIAKSGLDTLTRCAAEALAPEVQVNGVAPGAILFPEGTPEAERRRILERVPMRRTGVPDELAAVVLMLAGAPDYVTGTIIPVDGGASLS